MVKQTKFFSDVEIGETIEVRGFDVLFMTFFRPRTGEETTAMNFGTDDNHVMQNSASWCDDTNSCFLNNVLERKFGKRLENATAYGESADLAFLTQILRGERRADAEAERFESELEKLVKITFLVAAKK